MLHFAYPNSKNREKQFIGCGRYIALLPEDIPQNSAYEPAAEKTIALAEPVYTAVSSLARESSVSRRKIYEIKDRSSEKYFGTSQNFAYLLALISRSRTIKLEGIRGDLWCTGSISLEKSQYPRLRGVLASGFSIKLQAFLAGETPENLFLAPAINVEALASDLLHSSDARVMSLAELEHLPSHELVDRKTVVKVLDNELADVIRVLFHKPEKSLPPKQHALLPNPYRGLFAFQEKDANLFFGRETYVEHLLNAIAHKPFTALVGPSGSGKSSLIHAGLLPKLRCCHESHCQILLLRPGSDPVGALSSIFADLLYPASPRQKKAAERKLLHQQFTRGQMTLVQLLKKLQRQSSQPQVFLILDQFEELYTLCPDDHKRRWFLDELLAVIQHSATSKVCPHVVLAMRADFLGEAVSYRPFAEALQDATIFQGPMKREEFITVIEKPANIYGVDIEDGLTARIIQAIHDEPGTLPLLQFTLTALWERQQSRMLTHAAYDELGGVEEALAKYAEHEYQVLSPEEQYQVQRIFLQLVHPGEGYADTRRVANRSEIGDDSWKLVIALANARLVVTGNAKETGEQQETVEIVHEALLTSWQRLKEWIEAEREFRIWQERLRATLRQWISTDSDDHALLRGTLLGEAEYWLENKSDDLSAEEYRFITLSIQARDNLCRKKQIVRVLVLALAVFVSVVFVILGGVAIKERQNADIKTIEALTQSSRALFLTHHELDALLAGIKASIGIRSGSAPEQLYSETVANLQAIVYDIREINRLEGHQSSVREILFSPNGKLLASAENDGLIKIWDAQTGGEWASFPKQAGGVNSISFSPDSKILASGSDDGAITLWDVASGDKMMTLKGHSRQVSSVTFHPEGAMLASGSVDKTLKLWDINSGQEILTLPGHVGVRYVTCLDFSADGRLLVSGSGSKTPSIKLWSIPDGREIRTIYTAHSDIINSLSLSPDGKLLASGSWDSTVNIWNVENGKIITTLKNNSHPIWRVAFSRDGSMLASTGDSAIKLWYAPDFQEMLTIPGHTEEVSDVCFSPDGAMLASSSLDATIKLWDIARLKNNMLPGHSGDVRSIAFSPDGKLLASASVDKTVKLWDAAHGCEIDTEFYSQRPADVIFSPDGEQLAVTAGNDINLWPLNKNQQKTVLQGHTLPAWGLSFHPEGTILASGSHDRTIKLWDLGEGKAIRTLHGHSDYVWNVLFSPNGKWLASSGWGQDNTIRIWEAESGIESQTIRVPAQPYSNSGIALAFHPGGAILASGTNASGAIKLWEFPSGREIATLSGHTMTILSLDFSPDGRMLASSSEDKTVKLWDVADHRAITTLRGHSHYVRSVAFSPDGSLLASTSSDSTIKLWNIDDECNFELDDLLSRGCHWLQGYLKNNPNVSNDDKALCDKFPYHVQ